MTEAHPAVPSCGEAAPGRTACSHACLRILRDARSSVGTDPARAGGRTSACALGPLERAALLYALGFGDMSFTDRRRVGRGLTELLDLDQADVFKLLVTLGGILRAPACGSQVRL
jgi:hypothetical protein